jgi:AcrR family transcriptional regulator
MTSSSTRGARWRRAPEERPAQILAAALEIFGEVGLARARLDDIAKRAGISKGTIYVYFPDKEELFREVVRQNVIRNIERAERDFLTGDPVEQLRKYMRGYWQFLRSPVFAALYRMVMSELRNFPDLARFYADEAVERGLGLMTAIIQRGIDRGDFRRVDAAVAARGMAAMFIGHAIWCNNKEVFAHVAGKTDEEILLEMEDLVLHSLRP